mgnify:CR=1 FL=1
MSAMTWSVRTLLLSVAARAASPEPPAITPRERVALFNGRDLSTFTTWLAKHGTDDPDRVFTVVDRIDGARQAAQDLLAYLHPAEDEAALFTFDTKLNELQPFTLGLYGLPTGLAAVQPFGATSLHDAIAAAAAAGAPPEVLAAMARLRAEQGN